MPGSREDHISLDQIEMYSMGKLDDADSARIEEHLLICGPCRESLEETERYARAMRGAARTLEAEPAPVPWWSLRPAWVGTFATAAALLLFLMFRPSTPVAPAAVHLTALRGDELVQTVPPGAPLELHPDLTGLPSTPSSLEIVDAEGRAVWKGAISAAVVTAPPLRGGTYFLRVYGTSGELLREFALHAAKTPAASTAPR